MKVEDVATSVFTALSPLGRAPPAVDRQVELAHEAVSERCGVQTGQTYGCGTFANLDASTEGQISSATTVTPQDTSGLFADDLDGQD